MPLDAPRLPEPFAGWFAARGWTPHPHQLALIARAADPATPLIAPTGGGKRWRASCPRWSSSAPRRRPGSTPSTSRRSRRSPALLVWGLVEPPDPAALLDPRDLRAGLDTWLAGNAVMKRTFRTSARIAGLVDRNLPGLRKTGRQATVSSDILYDTLRRHDPGHLMLRVTRIEAGRGLVDFGRIEEMLARVAGRIDVVRAPRVTPSAAPLLLEVGRVPIAGQAERRLVAEAAATLLAEAGLPP